MTVAFFAALVLYDAYRAWRLQDASEAVIADTRQQAAEIARTAEQALEASRMKSVDIAQAARQAIDDNHAHAEQLAAADRARAVLASELALTSGLRVALTECYHNFGEWSADPATRCGIDPAAYHGRLLEQVRLEADGAFVASLRAGFGLAAGEIRFTPDATGANVLWNCSTRSYADIASVVPACSYAP
jgi:hypothetical protein